MTRSIRSSRTTVVPSIALVAVVCLLAGCSAASSGSPGTSPQGAPSSAGAAGSLQPASGRPSLEPAGSPGMTSLPASIVDPVVADIARRAGVPVDQVAVQSAEAVTFPDGGLGCPVPGMAYPQVQVDGYRSVAGAAGTAYDYRGSAPGRFRLCTPQK